MIKKKISKKQKFSLKDIPKYKVDTTKQVEFKPDELFKNEQDVALALFQCLIENDVEAFKEILDAYLKVNRRLIAKKANLSRSTVSGLFKKGSNSTLKTIAKVINEAHGLDKPYLNKK